MMKKITRLKISLVSSALLMVSACTGESPPATIDYPEEGSSVMRMYIARCGDCHVAPQPVSRLAKDWSSVLQRMQMRMKAKARTPLDKTEMAIILDYVQRHARVDSTQENTQ